MRDLEAAGVPRHDISIVASIVGNWYSDKGRRDARTCGVDRYADDTDDRAEGAGAGIGAAIAAPPACWRGSVCWRSRDLVPWWLPAARLDRGRRDRRRLNSRHRGRAHAGWCRRASETPTTRATEAMLDRSSVNIADRGAAYRKGGWQQFDPKAKPLTADEVRREREMYRRSAA